MVIVIMILMMTISCRWYDDDDNIRISLLGIGGHRSYPSPVYKMDLVLGVLEKYIKRFNIPSQTCSAKKRGLNSIQQYCHTYLFR